MTKPKYVVPTSLPRVPRTASTVEIYAQLRKALLEYVTPQGERLRQFIGEPERVYVRAQPSPVVFPYLTLTLTRTSDAAYNGMRETAILEVQAIGRPEAQLPVVESCMDIVDQCLTQLVSSTDGLIVCRSRTRQTLPQFTDDADAAVVGVLGQYTMYLWPTVLTSRA